MWVRDEKCCCWMYTSPSLPSFLYWKFSLSLLELCRVAIAIAGINSGLSLAPYTGSLLLSLPIFHSRFCSSYITFAVIVRNRENILSFTHFHYFSYIYILPFFPRFLFSTLFLLPLYPSLTRFSISLSANPFLLFSLSLLFCTNYD